MIMQEPFDIEVGETHYAVFPEGNDTYTIFKDGKEYVQVLKDTASIWLKMDEKTELPIFDEDKEVNEIGKAIEAYVPEVEEEDDEQANLN
ncbi:hypothetical protein EZJ43_16880 [Pedobacter changchengzhani]|uniref:Uncharacterized protein n=2 Tax=Pedobacter changchengzhani TaxID=2529274 RepID=A0A4R5MHK1_9SPHI|nr:hypothetical protein EZJ43_16880 [Pedobacter changchengzhani]